MLSIDFFGFQFVGVEGFVTAVSDIYPQLRRKNVREIFIACVCFAYFLIGLIMVTNVSF
jgi:hypothetical protein